MWSETRYRSSNGAKCVGDIVPVVDRPCSSYSAYPAIAVIENASAADAVAGCFTDMPLIHGRRLAGRSTVLAAGQFVQFIGTASVSYRLTLDTALDIVN